MSDQENLIISLQEGTTKDIFIWPNNLLQDKTQDRNFQSGTRGSPEMECATKYRTKTNHTALNKVNCSVCWDLVFERVLKKCPLVTRLPSKL